MDWKKKGNLVSAVVAIVRHRENCISQGGLIAHKDYSKQHKYKRREKEEDRGIRGRKEKGHIGHVCLLYWEGTLVKISVTLYWHSREWETEEEEKRGWAKKKKSEEKSVYSLFLPSSTQSFPSLFVHSVVYVLMCVSVCVYALLWHTWIFYWLPHTRHVFLEGF